MTLDEETAAPRRARRRPARRLVVAAVLTLVLAIGVLPDLFGGLDGHSPFAQLQAFRQWTLLGVAVLGLLLAAATLRWRRIWPFAAGVLAVAVVGAVLVVPRAVPDPAPTGGRTLTVLSFNTYEGHADVQALAAVIRTEKPDLVALPEAGDRFRSKLAPLIEPLGYRVRASTGPRQRDVNGVTVAVAGRLGDVQMSVGDDTTSFPYLVVTGGALGSLRFVGFHSVAPTLKATPYWRHDLGLLPQWCAGPTPAIVAGDFNATLDHSVLRDASVGCDDAAAQRGQGLQPTWGPTDLLRHTIGPQIDHVLSTNGIEASAFHVLDVPGSDHRPILATLQVP